MVENDRMAREKRNLGIRIIITRTNGVVER